MTALDVTATLRYLKPTDQPPVYYASRGGVDRHDIGIELEPHRVRIRDARHRKPSPGLEDCGFGLFRHAAGAIDFYAPGAVDEDYERGIGELVLRATEASDVLVFDHTLRSDSSAIRGERGTREPAAFVHNDYTDRSARKRLQDELPAEVARERLRQRFAIINVWRSIRGPVLNSPIACCDASSMAAADRVAVERRAHDRVGELEMVTWNPVHRWYYFPEMVPEEALLIKTFDSATDGRATRAIHGSFDNPLAPADAPHRESIESRLLVFYDS